MISSSRKALAALGIVAGCMSSFVPASLADEPAAPAKTAASGTGGVVTSVTTANSAPVTPAHEGWTNGIPVPEQQTYFQLDCLWLQRNRTSNFNVANAGAGGPVALDLYDVMGFTAEPGPRFTIGRRMDDQLAFEATYWGTHFWSNTAGVPGVASSIFLNGTFDNNYDLGILEQYTSRIHSAEFNIRRGAGTNGGFRAQGIAGFRFMNVEEAFEVRGVDNATASTSEAVANTNNYLFGLQVGADFSHCIFTPAFRVGTGIRGGLFLNYIDSDLRNQTASVDAAGAPTNTVLANFGDQTTALAGLIEWNFVMSMQVHRNVLIRGGYHVTYVPGVALAAESMFSAGQTAAFGVPAGGAGGAAIDRNGDMLVHGPFLGAEVRF